MAGRIRTIKPELLEDEKAAALSDAAWRLFVSSWLLADDHGRFRASARYLAAQVWQDTGKTLAAAAARDELAMAGRIRVYQIDGDTYAEIPTWAAHQRIDNAGRPRVPPPNGFAEIAPVSRRVAESRGESPLEPPEVAALPPTSDLRPPTSDPESTRAERPLAELGPAIGAVVGELGALAETLAAEGSGVGQAVCDRLAQGQMPTPKQLSTLRKIRDERAAASVGAGTADVMPEERAVVAAYLEAQLRIRRERVPELALHFAAARRLLPDLCRLAAAVPASTAGAYQGGPSGWAPGPADVARHKLETYLRINDPRLAEQGYPLALLLARTDATDLPKPPRKPREKPSVNNADGPQNAPRPLISYPGRPRAPPGGTAEEGDEIAAARDELEALRRAGGQES